ncbi:MAG: hypothetical protein SWY16_05640 [Cyanobacteriota bacterium]|nr:hypothetical protein [Cyanobacteriota bacterium]
MKNVKFDPFSNSMVVNRINFFGFGIHLRFAIDIETEDSQSDKKEVLAVERCKLFIDRHPSVPRLKFFADRYIR